MNCLNQESTGFKVREGGAVRAALSLFHREQETPFFKA